MQHYLFDDIINFPILENVIKKFCMPYTLILLDFKTACPNISDVVIVINY